MEAEFINITEENADTEHLCCIIRTRTAHPGVETKRRWLKDRLKEGHVFRKLNINGTVFIEYAPLETAWVPITGDNFYYIYCLWVTGAPKGHGYGKQLMEYCINDAKMRNKSGICMLGSKNKNCGCRIKSLRKVTALNRLTKRVTDTSCLRSALTEQCRGLRRTQRNRQSTAKNSRSFMMTNVRLPFRELKSCANIVNPTISTPILFTLKRRNRQRTFRACLIISLYFITENLKR